MLDRRSLPIICEAKPDSFVQWFACFKEIIHHPLLKEEEKFLWLWLATKITYNPSFSCSFNYEQIASAVNKSTKKIHRILTRLRVFGFLAADLPIYYGEPTLEMVEEVRTLRLKVPLKPFFVCEEKHMLPQPTQRVTGQQITINFFKESNKRKNKK